MKIFHNNKLLILREVCDKSFPETFSLCIVNKKQLADAVNRWLMLKNTVDVIIYGYSYKDMTNDFKSFFHFIEAAGGVVKNQQNKTLFIRRWDMYDLPKGKAKKGESPEKTALREVKEETGLKKISIEKELSTSYHIYFDGPPFYLKKTVWYLMNTTQTKGLKPQLEEEITDVIWLDKTACRKAFSETYRTLREMLENFVC